METVMSDYIDTLLATQYETRKTKCLYCDGTRRIADTIDCPACEIDKHIKQKSEEVKQ